MISVLVTAFGAFPGAPVNPTMAIAAALKRRSAALRRAGIILETAVMPVEFAGTRERLETLFARTRPDVVLHLGLAGRRKTVSVETRALNRLTILYPDAARKRAGSMQVEAGAPFVRRSRFAAGQLVHTISRAGAPAQLSIDAGQYLCNQVLYLSLGLHAGVCGFIHVPRPRRLRAPGGRREGNRRPGLADLGRAIEAAVRAMASDVTCPTHWRGGTPAKLPF